MIVFIKLVKRASILHEKFFIYKDQLTNNHTILSEYKQTHQTNKQYFIMLSNKQTNKQTIIHNISTQSIPTPTPLYDSQPNQTN